MKQFVFNIFDDIGKALCTWNMEANTMDEAIQNIKDKLCFEMISEEELKEEDIEQKRIDAEEEEYYREEYFRYEEQRRMD